MQEEELIFLESKRLSEKYNKEYLDCKDLMQIMGLGKDNVRDIMNSKDFPTMKIGKRKIVNIIAFVSWQYKITKSKING